MRNVFRTLSLCALFFFPALTFGGIAVDSPSPLSGFTECRPGFSAPQCTAVEFLNDENLASLDNGFAQPAVAFDVIPGFSAIHRPEFANDGFYGNGASWIGNTTNSWVKIDLGRTVIVSSVRFGRDRNGGFNDRDPGSVSIAVATSDDVYANGNDSNDGTEYTQVLAPTPLVISGSATYKADFPPVSARYIKMTLVHRGAAIDEIEVAGPVGACCTDGPGTQSDCIVDTQADCESEGGLFVGAGTVCADVPDCTTLLVTMESMSATATPGGVLVTWTTVTEVDAVGFRVLRETPGTREKTLDIIAPMIPAAGNGLTGATYQFLDNTVRTGTTVRYYIEDVDIFGKVTRHGPIVVERIAPTRGRRVAPTR